jgi:hypothetical protein
MQNPAARLTGETSSNDLLTALRTKVEDLRQDLYFYARTLPSPLGPTVISHYEERVRRARGLPMLGEYAPFLLGDLFGVKQQSIEQLAFPWLLLYEYTLLLDDLADRRRSLSSHKLVLSQMLLASSLKEFKRVLGDSRAIWAAFDSYQREWLVGSLHESDFSSLKDGHPPLEIIRQQGRRAAMAKFCAASLLYLDANRLLTPSEESSIDHFCAGIMLLDDLTDVLEDHTEGLRNFVLERTHRWFKAKVSSEEPAWANLDIDQLTVGLVYSGAIGESWIAAANEIDKALGAFNRSENQAAKYFGLLSDRCRGSAHSIQEAAAGLPTFQPVFLHKQGKAHRSNILNLSSAILRRSLKKVIQQIDNGPRACQ